MADPHHETGPARRDGPLALAIGALVLATVIVGGLGGPGGPPHAAPPAAAVRPESDPACLEWGDGCHVCQRRPEGDACSLPGIACTPGPERCLRRASEP